MSLIRTLDMPPEIWLKISNYFGSVSMYHNDSLCSGPASGTGAGTVTPLPSSAPLKDLINLPCVCQQLHWAFEGDIKVFLSLCIWWEDRKLGHQCGSDFIPDRNFFKQGTTAEVHKLATVLLRNHSQHFCLMLREYSHDSDDFHVLNRLVCGR